MAKRNAARKKRSNARTTKTETRRRPPAGTGGKRRGEMEVQDITHQVAMALLYGQGRTVIAQALGHYLKARGWQDDDTPMPFNTVDDYIKRVKEMQAEEQSRDREDLRVRQSRRLHQRMMKADADDRHRDALRAERLLMDIDGTAAPKRIIASTSPGEPLEVRLRDPELMTTGERRRRIEQLEAEERAEEREDEQAAAAARAAAEPPPPPSAPPPDDPPPAPPAAPSTNWRSE
jgi:hypothetical protein